MCVKGAKHKPSHVVLFGTYKVGQLERWTNYYNYPISEKDKIDETHASLITELQLYCGSRNVRCFKASFVGIKTRKELIDKYNYPARGKGHGEKYLLFKRLADSPPSTCADKLIVRTKDFARSSPKVARQLKKYLKSPDRNHHLLAKYLPEIIIKTPPDGLSVNDDYIQLDLFTKKAVSVKRKTTKAKSTPVKRKRIKGKRPVIPELQEKPWSVFDHLPDEKDCPWTHVSLFSGCGGFDLGFRACGFKTIFANDFNEDAVKTYKHNLGNILQGDIRQVTFPKMPRPDLLTAGFPCQPFSNAGLRKGTKDSRGDLYLSALNAVRVLKPKTVVFENVRGLLSSKHEGRRVIEIIVENLNDLGYATNFSLVDASKHNVPSQRLRVLIIGVHGGEGLGRFAFPMSTVRPELALKNIIFDIPRHGVTDVNEVIEYSPQAQALEKFIPEGGSWRDIPYEALPERMKKIKDNIVRYHYPRFYQRCDRDEIAGTITASFQPEKASVFHPRKHRALSVREVARIQSFPDWYQFFGTTSAKYLQIGNAVPPRLAYELGLQLARVLKGEDLLAGREFIRYDEFVAKKQILHISDCDVVCD